LYLAQAKGFFNDEGVKVALLEPNDPSVSDAAIAAATAILSSNLDPD
jgi:ABC-type nitrate/sulfonate/bicarbonate transport system substrate-binding protein